MGVDLFVGVRVVKTSIKGIKRTYRNKEIKRKEETKEIRIKKENTNKNNRNTENKCRR